ncbi:hypothetical protein [Woeseia oceani]|uniref:hypothetical protein n=1 Tax=Woeseia oceani TaxID=1548547 RepID=UPI0012E9ECF3|nr:hypothetical protein [Woeseia oceani]
MEILPELSLAVNRVSDIPKDWRRLAAERLFHDSIRTGIPVRTRLFLRLVIY